MSDKSSQERQHNTEQARLADAFERSPSFMAILTGPQHVFERANDRYLDLIGHRDVIGKSVREALPEIGRQGFIERLDTVFQTGEAFVGSNVRVSLQQKPDEPPDVRFVDFVYQPLRDQGGAISGILVQGIDWTDRRRAEEALRESEEQRRLALDSAELGAWNINPATNLLISDDRFRMIFQGSTDPITYEQAFAAIHPDDRQRVRDAVAAATRPERPAPYAEEYRVVHPDRSVHWVFGKGRAHFEPTVAGQRLSSFDGTVMDITDQRNAKAEVARLGAESERLRRLYDTVLSNSADFNYTFDLDGRFSYVNRALLDLWQKDLAQAVGKNFFDLDYPPELAGQLQRQIQQVIESRQPLRDETPYASAQGERQYEYIFVPVIGTNGAVEAVAGSTRDITEKKQVEEELRNVAARLSEADHRKDEFIAMLAHELRNPLAPCGTACNCFAWRDWIRRPSKPPIR